jgi:hypothetical protein
MDRLTQLVNYTLNRVIGLTGSYNYDNTYTSLICFTFPLSFNLEHCFN